MCSVLCFLMSVLVTAHIVNGLDFSLEQNFKNEDYESD